MRIEFMKIIIDINETEKSRKELQKLTEDLWE